MGVEALAGFKSIVWNFLNRVGVPTQFRKCVIGSRVDAVAGPYSPLVPFQRNIFYFRKNINRPNLTENTPKSSILPDFATKMPKIGRDLDFRKKNIFRFFSPNIFVKKNTG